jgi:SAM-dependent methyltransferase
MSTTRIEPLDFRALFANATKRYAAFEFPTQPPGEVINLGSGRAPISGAINLDRPEWEAPFIDCLDESIAAIHAYHFLEHLPGDIVSRQLAEVDRVLKPDGLFYYAVPYAGSPIAFMDVDHKTFWTEETMRTLIQARGYNSVYTFDPRLEMIFQIIAGINSQNLMVIGVLQKGKARR